jgi:hypothetical protein
VAGLGVPFRILIELVLAFLPAENVTLTLERTRRGSFLLVDLLAADHVSLHWFVTPFSPKEELSPRAEEAFSLPIRHRVSTEPGNVFQVKARDSANRPVCQRFGSTRLERKTEKTTGLRFRSFWLRNFKSRSLFKLGRAKDAVINVHRP